MLGYRIDLDFHDHKLAIEIDLNYHSHMNFGYEIKRQKAIEKKKIGCKFIRIDREGFDIFKAINEIFRHIKQLSNKLTKTKCDRLRFIKIIFIKTLLRL